MRYAALVLMLCLAAPVMAEDQPPLPADLKPVPEPPPLPPVQADEELEPQVTITKQGENTVEEYRINGFLYMKKITPSHGKSYYLVDRHGDGNFIPLDNLDDGLRAPQWVFIEW